LFVTLRCAECDNCDCRVARKYIPEGSLEGCTRKVSDLEADKYQHIIVELLPTCHLLKNPMPLLGKAEEFLQQLYSREMGAKIDARGKALPKPIPAALPQEDN